MSNKLSGKVAVVTGASKGIGAEIAKELAAAGATVVVNYASSKAGADKVVAAIKEEGGQAVAIQADVSAPAGIASLFEQVKQQFDKVDVLVNNAGIYDFKPLDEITPEHFDRQFNLNVKGLLLTTQAAVRLMNGSGSIVNISSVVSTFAPPNGSVYSATKAAVDAVTRSLSKELGPRGIRINNVNPGMVQTEGAAELTAGDMGKQITSMTPLGRIGAPHDIAPAVAFLASDDAAWITGETLYISGGQR